MFGCYNFDPTSSSISPVHNTNDGISGSCYTSVVPPKVMFDIESWYCQNFRSQLTNRGIYQDIYQDNIVEEELRYSDDGSCVQGPIWQGDVLNNKSFRRPRTRSDYHVGMICALSTAH